MKNFTNFAGGIDPVVEDGPITFILEKYKNHLVMKKILSIFKL